VNSREILVVVQFEFVRIHQTLKITPGVTSTLWEMSDMAKMLEDWEAAEAARGAA
jgi:hypothetical protein